MGNCLVTKLKGVVDNDNLNKLGVFRFVIKTKNNLTTAQLMLNKTNQNTVVKDEKGNILATITDIQGRYNMAANSTFVVEMYDKYAFQYITIAGQSAVSEIKANLDELKYSKLESAENTGLSIFTLYPGITGHISNFIHLMTATELNLSSSSIEGSLEEITQLKPNLTGLICSEETTGNITELSSLVGLTELNLGVKVSYLNSLQQFLDGMAANRKSGTLTLTMLSDYAGNNAGITKYNPVITFTNDGWTWA